MLKKGNSEHNAQTLSRYNKGSTANRQALLRQAARNKGGEYENTTETIGWRPTCSHYDDAYRAFTRVRSKRKRYQQDAQNEWFKRARKRPLEVAPCDRCNGTGIDPDEEPQMACYDCVGAGFQEIVTAPAIVFDPFVGSGTTMVAARRLNRAGIGSDISGEYLELAKKRLNLKALQDWETGRGKKGNMAEEKLPDLPLWNNQ